MQSEKVPVVIGALSIIKKGLDRYVAERILAGTIIITEIQKISPSSGISEEGSFTD